MSKCSNCGIETNLFCGKCKPNIEDRYNNFIPLIFYNKKEKCYQFYCNFISCPCNNGLNLCGVKHQKLLLSLILIHEFDGINCIKQICG